MINVLALAVCKTLPATKGISLARWHQMFYLVTTNTLFELEANNSHSESYF
jgi:hypothetical protein